MNRRGTLYDLALVLWCLLCFTCGLMLAWPRLVWLLQATGLIR